MAIETRTHQSLVNEWQAVRLTDTEVAALRENGLAGLTPERAAHIQELHSRSVGAGLNMFTARTALLAPDLPITVTD